MSKPGSIVEVDQNKTTLWTSRLFDLRLTSVLPKYTIQHNKCISNTYIDIDRGTRTYGIMVLGTHSDHRRHMMLHRYNDHSKHSKYVRCICCLRGSGLYKSPAPRVDDNCVVLRVDGAMMLIKTTLRTLDFVCGMITQVSQRRSLPRDATPSKKPPQICEMCKSDIAHADRCCRSCDVVIHDHVLRYWHTREALPNYDLARITYMLQLTT